MRTALNGIWGRAKDDVWAVGNSGLVLHFDGTSWTQQSVPALSLDDLQDIWGPGTDELWAVGAQRIYHYRP